LIRFTDITLGHFAPRDSVIHRLDSRTKILAGVILMTLIFLAPRLSSLLVIALGTIVLYQAARLNTGLAFRNIRPFLWILILTVIIHALFTEGHILIRLPLSLAVTTEGIHAGLFYSFRIVVLILSAALITLTTSPMALTDAIERFLKPLTRLGLPAHEIAMMMSISMRFIPTLMEETDRIRKAQISRGSRINGSPVQRIKGLIPLIIPLFVSTFRRANDLALAMEARCYRGGENRTSYQALRFRWVDGAALGVVAVSGIMILAWV